MQKMTSQVDGSYVPVVKTTDKSVFSISPRPAGEFIKGDRTIIYGAGHTLRVVAISGSGASKITVKSFDELKIIRDIIDEYLLQDQY